MSTSTTTSGLFRTVEDVTVYPKRMQSEVANEISSTTTTVRGNNATLENDIPTILTLERAIKYFEDHAQGEVAKFYEFTAKQLRELLNKNIPVEVTE